MCDIRLPPFCDPDDDGPAGRRHSAEARAFLWPYPDIWSDRLTQACEELQELLPVCSQLADVVRAQR
eukprot:595416-Pyramimonas_sp.AAC.1